MDIKKLLIVFFCCIYCNIYAQKCLKISAQPDNFGVISVNIKNECKSKKILTLDSSGINMGCSQDDFYSYTFLRMSLCVNFSKNIGYPFGFLFAQGPVRYGINNNMVLKEYLSSSLLILQPKEEKQYHFHYTKQEEMLEDSINDTITTDAKMVLYTMRGKKIKKLFSNNFEITLPVIYSDDN